MPRNGLLGCLGLMLGIASSFTAPYGSAAGEMQEGPFAGRISAGRGGEIEIRYSTSRPVNEQRVEAITIDGQTVQRSVTVTRWVTEERVTGLGRDCFRATTPEGQAIEGDELTKRLATSPVVLLYRGGQQPEAAYLALLKPEVVLVAANDKSARRKIVPVPNAAAAPGQKIAVVPGEPIPSSPQPSSPQPAPPQPALAQRVATAPQRVPDGAPEVEPAMYDPGVISLTGLQAAYARYDAAGRLEVRSASVSKIDQPLLFERAGHSQLPGSIKRSVTIETVEVFPADVVAGFDLAGKRVDYGKLAPREKEAPLLVIRGVYHPEKIYSELFKPDTVVVTVPRQTEEPRPRRRVHPQPRADDAAPRPPAPSADPSA